jgi:hypothetical protein
MFLQIQAAPPSVDTLASLLTAIDQLVTTAAALLPVAQAWGYAFAVLSFTILCLYGCVYAIRQQSQLIVVDLIVWLTKVLSVSFMLGFYTVPIPVLGITVPDLFTRIGSQIAAVIGVATLDQLLTQINTCVRAMEHPPYWNFFAVFIYFFVLGAMTVLAAALLLITALGFLAIGIGKVFGPILITFLLLPGWEKKFWNWVDFMWVYAMYRAVAAAFVFVASTFLLNFFNQTLHGDYTIGHWAALFLLMVSSILVIIFGAFKVPHWTVELFGGGLGHAGSDFGNTIKSVLLMLARP